MGARDSPLAHAANLNATFLNAFSLQELEDLEREHEALKQAVEGKVRRWVGRWRLGASRAGRRTPLFGMQARAATFVNTRRYACRACLNEACGFIPLHLPGLLLRRLPSWLPSESAPTR